jgi:hypothetical protein
MTKNLILNGSGAPYNIWIKGQFPAPHVVVNPFLCRLVDKNLWRCQVSGLNRQIASRETQL